MIGEHFSVHRIMAKIVLTTLGSLGDMHPKISIGLELKKRGHDVTIAAMEFYREKIGLTGLGFTAMRPNLNPDDRGMMREMMDANTGTERILREVILGNLRPMYDDLMTAVEGSDLLVSGEIVCAVKSVVEKTGIKWVSTSLAPVSFISAYDPSVPPPAPWFERFRFLGPSIHGLLFSLAKNYVRKWYGPYREFRKELGLDEDHDPIFDGKFSTDLHLAIFSKVLGSPQPDWPSQTVQSGFCFYDGQADLGIMPKSLSEFLDAGDAPIVFTLGSAAVMDPRDFFDESVKAAKTLGRRAVLLYGIFNEPPKGLTDDIAAFDYAPFSLLFPRAACVVHQAGVGTTGQVLRAGVPHLIMPYGHDQPDNAARCRRAGVAEIISRDSYNARTAAEALRPILSDPKYRANAVKLKQIVVSEHGSAAACDAIEGLLLN
ncbi:MAG: nucleotide disphospho-sugar-binding domain-containing protein [Pyrinomonadaceae bacterium]